MRKFDIVKVTILALNISNPLLLKTTARLFVCVYNFYSFSFNIDFKESHLGFQDTENFTRKTCEQYMVSIWTVKPPHHPKCNWIAYYPERRAMLVGRDFWYRFSVRFLISSICQKNSVKFQILKNLLENFPLPALRSRNTVHFFLKIYRQKDLSFPCNKLIKKYLFKVTLIIFYYVLSVFLLFIKIPLLKIIIITKLRNLLFLLLL